MFGFILHFLKFLVAIVLGIIWLPLNHFLLWVAGHYQTIKKESIILYWIVRIVIFPVWAIAAIFSAPYEMLVDSLH